MKTLNYWKILVNLWTVALFASISYDYFFINEITGTIAVICSVYSGTLAIYSADKEFERWHDSHRERHPGEIYVVLWTALMLALILAQTLKNGYKIPTEIISTYIVVLGTLAVTRKSREMYNLKKENKLQ